MQPILLKWSTSITDTIIDVLGKVFNTLATPLFVILKTILVVLVEQIYRLVSATLRQWLYILLRIVDFFESIFDIFAGLEPVTYKGEDKTLLDVFITNDALSQAFLLVTVIGVALCFVFTIYTVGKSIGTYMLEEKKPVSHVMKKALKSCLMFLLVPFIAYFGIRLSTQLLVSTDLAICNAMGSDDTIPMSTVLFLSGTFDGETNADFGTGVRADYLNGQSSIYNEAQTIIDFKMEDLDLDLLETALSSDGGSPNDFLSLGSGGYNYLLVYAEALIVIVIMLCGMFSFVRYMFEVMILYITAPLFVSTIPLDDGATFKRWRELFIGKLISGYGTVFTMKIMLMLIPIIVGGNVTLTGDSMIDAVIKTIFAIGSLFASFKCQHTIIQAFSPEIAMAAKESTRDMIGLGKKAISLAAQAGAAVATGGASAAGTAATSAAGAAGSAGAASAAGGAFTGGAGAVGGLGTGGAAGGSGAFTGGAGGAGGLTGSAGSSGNAAGSATSGTNAGAANASGGGSGGSGGRSGASSAGQRSNESTGGKADSQPKSSGSEDHGSSSARSGDAGSDRSFTSGENDSGGLETGSRSGSAETESNHSSDISSPGERGKEERSRTFRDNGISVKDIIDTVSTGNSETDSDDDELKG